MKRFIATLVVIFAICAVVIGGYRHFLAPQPPETETAVAAADEAAADSESASDSASFLPEVAPWVRPCWTAWVTTAAR